MAWNFHHTGKWTLNPESLAWLKTMVESENGTDMEETLSELGNRSKPDLTLQEMVSNDPGRFARHILENAHTFYKETLPKEVTPLFLFLAGVGFLSRPTLGYSRLAVFLPFFLPLPLWMLMRGGEPRDAIPLIPPILILSGAGAWELWSWANRGDRPETPANPFFPRLFVVVLLSLAVAFCLPGALRYRLGNQGQEVEHRFMGEWIRENYPPEERVLLTRKPMIAYYADGESESLVLGSLEDLRIHALQSEAKFLVMDSRTTAAVYPQYAPLMESDHPPEWLTPVHSVEAPDGETMVLYEVMR